MANIITIPLNAISAAQHIISKETTRPYLNGALIEKCGEHVVMVCTDGRIMTTTKFADAQCNRNFLLAITPLLKPALAQVDKKLAKICGIQTWLRVDDIEGHQQAAIAYANTSAKAAQLQWNSLLCAPFFSVCELDFSFPAWRRVLPVGDAQTTQTILNLGLLIRLNGFLRTLADSKITFATVDTSAEFGAPFRAASVDKTGNHTVATIIPEKRDAADTMPNWLTEIMLTTA